MKKCADFQNLIRESKLNELNLYQRFSVKRHMSQCRDCAAVFAEESEVRNFFSMVPELKCPDSLSEQIAVQTFNKPERKSQNVFSFALNSPQLSFAVVAAVVVILLIINFPGRNNPAIQSYNPEEIALARKQARWSLAYTGNLLNKTEKNVVEDVLFKQVPGTIRKSLKKSLKVF